ncbi:MAG: bifunctional 5,10-methylenetetrahydrofolate dehydrogenase/5,10-methenyltetrahydrofolate cyclohydrolase [Candidatus Eisenbacteria bacterium]|uniref:Bifunctional protein FolD n=1 Tax=Eiseniibacteriota bacterium TaxID=2212470 RepID=A0A956LXJ8_UNCEI|nr:bifunctional 5,10-methylenetetrahydrofolate dehydrogenase/5,10-methenyltetrahydrofolate cyclohydrolase [Candidatus Eisenbacteria bacterium]
MDGKSLASEIQTEIARRTADLPDRPGLLLIRVGEDPASVVYVRSKERSSKKVGIDSRVEVYPADTTEAALLARIDEANRDPQVHGILVQLPLPPQIRADVVALAVDPAKDVDALHPINQGKLALGQPDVVSCTPLGILALLKRYGLDARGKRAVVLGRSAIVGRPMSLLLSQKAPWGDATVTVVHSRSRDLPAITREADLVVAAMGSREAVTAEMIRPGAIVVDVGMHRLPDPERPGKEKLLGDVHAAGVEPVAGYLSPVPGGVGPLTVTMLLANTLYCYEAARGRGPEPVAFALALVPENA